MSARNKITLRELIEDYPHGLRIPEIQRDYVMGSGGNKLENLLNAIAAAFKNNKDFDFSCIITYCSDKENAPLDIYDGQQRITTLIILTMLKGKQIWKKCPLEFPWRDDVNKLLKKLNDEGADNISDDDIYSFSTFSMVNLIGKADIIKDVPQDYLLKRVKFDMVSIGCQNEMEQFFMDLNSGVKLKEYELYKAKLVHHIGTLNSEIYDESNKNTLYLFPFKMDNEWLDFFRDFADFQHPAEEYETAFIKYCITMICRDRNITELKDSLDYISEEVISQLFGIMENVTKLHICNSGKDVEAAGILHFSWGDHQKEENKSQKNNYDKRGAYWNLEFEDYDRHFIFVIQKCLIYKDKHKDMQKDTVLWCYITSLDRRIDVQKEYLRLIKILLNNVFYNERAWYECHGYGQYLYDCRYIVYGIPQYYGTHLDEKDKKLESFLSDVDKAKKFHDAIFRFNKWVTENLPALNLLNKRKIAVSLHEILLGFEDEKIKKLVDIRLKSLKESDYEEYLKKENLYIGILKCIDNIKSIENLRIKDIDENIYLCEVMLDWSVRSKKNEPLPCHVIVKCLQDKLYDLAKIFPILFLYEYKPEFVQIDTERFSDKDKEKTFWCPESGKYYPYKLQDRKTDTSTTYNQNRSSSGWKDKLY